MQQITVQYFVTESLTCEEEEDKDHNHSVSKVEEGAGCSNYL